LFLSNNKIKQIVSWVFETEYKFISQIGNILVALETGSPGIENILSNVLVICLLVILKSSGTANGEFIAVALISPEYETEDNVKEFSPVQPGKSIPKSKI